MARAECGESAANDAIKVNAEFAWTCNACRTNWGEIEAFVYRTRCNKSGARRGATRDDNRRAATHSGGAEAIADCDNEAAIDAQRSTQRCGRRWRCDYATWRPQHKARYWA